MVRRRAQAQNFNMSGRAYKKRNPERNPGHFIREWREFRNLSQERVAERVGLSVPQVSRIETGNQGYRRETLEKFAQALGCDPADLLRPPPIEGAESEFEAYVKKLDAGRRKRALAILKAALGDEEKSA